MRIRKCRERLIVIGLTIIVATPVATGRNPYRRNFFDAYPLAVGTRLDNLPSRAQHCGVCHFDFAGGGPRNPYGQAVEATDRSVGAILGLGGFDFDSDGSSNVVEILDAAAQYANTPTFPGLTAGNVGMVLNVSLDDILGHLTPALAGDTEPPVVDVLFPAGGELLGSSTPQVIQWTATDNSGVVVAVDVYVSFDGGVRFDPLALGVPNAGQFLWHVQNRPTTEALVQVVAVDAASNVGTGESEAFGVFSSAVGRVPTTLRDFDMPGTQPIEAGGLYDPSTCVACHSGYGQPGVEPYHNWQGSLMAHASIDPLFQAALSVANADAPESGDLCLRCHNSQGWLGGRSTPTDGSQMVATDLIGVSCDLCHRLVDPAYEPGESPVEDQAILAGLVEVPSDFTLGQYVVDPSGTRRGPFADAAAPHAFLASPFHREAAFCGTCHDVSNPVFVRGSDGTYTANAFDAPAGEFGPHQIGVVERTYSEWLHSAYNTALGVYAPEFGGNRQYVASCQDCHMRALTGQGCNEPSAPLRDDLPLHDMTGGSTWLPALLPLIDPTVDVAALQDGIGRARRMLKLAAELDVRRAGADLIVSVTNNTGHKLPTGYPEGRRIWLNVRFFDGQGALLSESGAYDLSSGELTRDPELKVYEVIPVIGDNIAPVVGLPAGTEFHFVLNNEIVKDNRIPPLGFTNAAYEAFGGASVGAAYADGQNWDETRYAIPPGMASVEVTLYYQSVSREFAEFLDDNSAPGGPGELFYALWNQNGKSPPEMMRSRRLTFPVWAAWSMTAAADTSERDPQPATP